MYEKIKAKVKLGLPITEKERAMYILFIAADEELDEVLNTYEKEGE